MNKWLKIWAVGMAAALSGCTAVGESAVTVKSLRCEYLADPLGIDAIQPRLSWVMESAQRGQRQSGYQVLVASDKEKLATNHGDLWDSGKVDSDQSIQVAYQGKALKSFQRCYWKVRIWDKVGEPSGWSEPAMWSMGILGPNEWQGKWIGFVQPIKRDDDKPAMTLRHCQWIWHPDGGSRMETPAGVRYFRRSFEIPENDTIKWAGVMMAADGNYVLYVNGKKAAESPGGEQIRKEPQVVEITPYLQVGKNVLAVEANHPANGPAGIIGQAAIALAKGSDIIVSTDRGRSIGVWRSHNEQAAGWTETGFDDANWPMARVLGGADIEPWQDTARPYIEQWRQKYSSPMLRKEFAITKPFRNASVYICGLGYYELRLNGGKVGDHELDPAFTRYDKRALYVSYDVTEHLRVGKNAVGVMLGSGWYDMHTRATWDFDQAVWRDRPKMLLNLRVEYVDGSVETISSDDSWRGSTGPIIYDGIRNGEEYDARREKEGWDRPGYDDAGWKKAQVAAAAKGKLCAQMMPAIKVTQKIKPAALTEPKPGVYVFDMGQNFAGWCRLKVSGPSGSRVQMRYSERVDSEGMIERSRIDRYVFQGPFQTDTYILKGQGVEEWQPRFTYHGFRYVEVTGFPGRATRDSLEGCVAHTAFGGAGSFECSNEMLNQIQQMSLWSYRSNYYGYPTDCPQREKNGWTGDAQLAAEMGMYNFENAAGYTKWINDFDDAQQADGQLPAIVPTGGWGYSWGNGPGWCSAYLLIPWYLYQYRGDVGVLERHYEGMKRYVDYLAANAKDYILDMGLGDWVFFKSRTPRTVTSTAYFYVDSRIVAEAARLIGKKEDAEKYSRMAEEIRQAFNKTFYKGDGVYDGGSQTALSCALYQGLTPAAEKQKVVEQLVQKVKQTDYHLDVGILGAKYIFNALSENGEHEVAYRLATQKTFPGYGDWIAKGATNLWEDWTDTEGSLNHVMFGDISGWFYKYLAGIQVDPDEPAFKHIVIHPQPVGELQWVKASHNSMYGVIRSEWQKTDGNFTLRISVPVNTTATVYLPADDIKGVTESGRAITKADEVEFLRMEEGAAICEVGAGDYTFEVMK